MPKLPTPCLPQRLCASARDVCCMDLGSDAVANQGASDLGSVVATTAMRLVRVWGANPGLSSFLGQPWARGSQRRWRWQGVKPAAWKVCLLPRRSRRLCVKQRLVSFAPSREVPGRGSLPCLSPRWGWGSFRSAGPTAHAVGYRLSVLRTCKTRRSRRLCVKQLRGSCASSRLRVWQLASGISPPGTPRVDASGRCP